MCSMCTFVLSANATDRRLLDGPPELFRSDMHVNNGNRDSLEFLRNDNNEGHNIKCVWNGTR